MANIRLASVSDALACPLNIVMAKSNNMIEEQAMLKALGARRSAKIR
jgi:cysteine synthase